MQDVLTLKDVMMCPGRFDKLGQWLGQLTVTMAEGGVAGFEGQRTAVGLPRSVCGLFVVDKVKRTCRDEQAG